MWAKDAPEEISDEEEFQQAKHAYPQDDNDNRLVIEDVYIRLVKEREPDKGRQQMLLRNYDQDLMQEAMEKVGKQS